MSSLQTNTTNIQVIIDDLSKVPNIEGDVAGSIIDRSIAGSLTMKDVTYIGTQAFQGCANLTSVDFPAATLIDNQVFFNCTGLTSVDLPAAITVGNKVFEKCSNLTALILRNTELVTAYSSVLDDTPVDSGTGYIYVPKALIEDYKVATNWSTYASQFRAIEDYTVDGTITGALDESKI